MKTFSVIFLLLYISILHSQDFRGYNWGEDRVKILKETKLENVYKDKEIEIFKGEVGGLSSAIAFMFDEKNKLVGGGYVFDESHTNSNLYIEDYSKIKEIIREKYGDIEDEIIWSNDLYKDDPSYYGMSLSMGYHSYYYKYESETTIIFGTLSGDNLEIEHKLVYKSKNYEHPKEKTSDF